MEVCRLPLVLLGLVLFVSPLQAKKKHHHHDNDSNNAAYAAPTPELAPTVDPAALPSASLQPFLDSHLDRVLAPLGTSEFSQQAVVTSLKTSFLGAMATAPANRKPAFAAAGDVCDALTTAMIERQKAVDAWHGSVATHSSEVNQPRGNRRLGKEQQQGEDDFFRRGVENGWNQQIAVLRQNVTALVLREHDLERQAAIAPAKP